MSLRVVKTEQRTYAFNTASIHAVIPAPPPAIGGCVVFVGVGQAIHLPEVGVRDFLAILDGEDPSSGPRLFMNGQG